MGSFHGLNPGMGWLFAVAIGFQERSRAALLRALPPIAAGHALSIGAVALVVAVPDSGLAPRPVALGGGDAAGRVRGLGRPRGGGPAAGRAAADRAASPALC